MWPIDTRPCAHELRRVKDERVDAASVEGRNVKKDETVKRRDERQRRSNISQARRPLFTAILCMRITDSAVLRAAVVRFRVDVRGRSGNRDGFRVGEDVDENSTTEAP